MKEKVLLALLAGLTAASPSFAQSSSTEGSDFDFATSFNTGLTYSVGKYGGTQDVEVVSIPLGLRARHGQFQISARMPYLRVEGPGRFIGSGEGLVIIEPGQPTQREVRKGLGDLNLGATYSVPNTGIGGLAVDVSSNIRLPTSAKRKRFGTGETDVRFGADFSLPNDDFTPYASIGYRMPGDAVDLDLRNSFTGSVGGTLKLGAFYGTASYDYAGASSSFSRASHSLFAALSRPVGKNLNLTGFGLVGLSQGSADFGTGLLLSASIF